MLWGRRPNENPPAVPSDDDVFNRPGDVRSLPRDGQPKPSDEPELLWGRSGGNHPPGVPSDDDIFNRPGDVRSLPRDGQPKSSDDPEMLWARDGGSKVPGIDLDEDVFDRPGDVRSIPAQPADVAWTSDKPDNTDWSNKDPNFDWSGAKRNKLNSTPRPGGGAEPTSDWASEEPTAAWQADKPDNSDWTKDQPDFDWSGARPNKLTPAPRPGEGNEPFERPEMDWSKQSPEADWQNEDPTYDWSAVSATKTPEELEDNLSEESEEDEDKPTPVTGVPLAVWTMLALGVVAGGLASTAGPSASTVAASGGPPPDFLRNQPNQGGLTDKFFPDPSTLPPCVNDPACGIVMSGLGPIIPPGSMALFDIPGSCQAKARDWLRTGKDVLEFEAERIRQRYAVSVFFCEMDGGNWLENDMWLSDLHECDWYNRIGLDPCNRQEQMEMIRLHDMGLQGTMPPELAILSTLYEFTVSDNLVTGTFPAEYSALSELDTFCIAFNLFEGPLPGFVFRFPDMVYLDIAYNKFTGQLPKDIPTRMPDLQVFFAENNDISGPIPDNLGDLNLRRVHLDDNAFTGTIPSNFGNAQRLQQLYLHGNDLEGPIPSELQQLTVLNEATFHANPKVEGAVDQEICNLMYQKQLKTITADSANVACECCSPEL